MLLSKKNVFILGIETSCDDTCAAVSSNENVLSSVIFSQKEHIKYGGVFPEIAARKHAENIVPVVDRAITDAGISKEELDIIAFTQGPGLNGGLLVGAMYAKTLSFCLNKPLIAVNHMYGHILANFIDKPKPDFPFLCLIVTGGHTQIYLVKSFYEFKIIGETMDDAVGEAYDKIGRMFGLEYPGGPKIDLHAKNGDCKKFKFNKAKIDGLNFSFSGIKTTMKIFLEKQDENFVKENIDDLCASIQECLLEMLMEKLVKAIKLTGVKTVAIGGGVAANDGLKKKLQILGEKMNLKIFCPEKKYCTDNAAMIALVAYYKYLKNDFANLKTDINPDLK